MKFDFCIGNPPFNNEAMGTSDDPVYHLFMDTMFETADKVELITPARFLFDAGKTPKAWNKKILNDEHFKVLEYQASSKNIFPNTDIKGGVAIHYRDAKKDIGPIETFFSFEEMNSIREKVWKTADSSLSVIIYSAESYKFTQQMYKDHPEILSMKVDTKDGSRPLISNGHKMDLVSNIFEKLSDIVFFPQKPSDGLEYMQIYGRSNNERRYMWIRRDYIADAENLLGYKVFVPKANGSGAIGEVLSTPVIGAPVIGAPVIGHTQTFISIGNFSTQEEAENVLKYLKSRFCRTMLSMLKVTQINQRPTWRLVPMQDFTSSSDIDWSKSIPEIDQQLYTKYGLQENEITFIETHVKEME